jgi:hypothetical protein
MSKSIASRASRAAWGGARWSRRMGSLDDDFGADEDWEAKEGLPLRASGSVGQASSKGNGNPRIDRCGDVSSSQWLKHARRRCRNKGFDGPGLSRFATRQAHNPCWLGWQDGMEEAGRAVETSGRSRGVGWPGAGWVDFLEPGALVAMRGPTFFIVGASSRLSDCFPCSPFFRSILDLEAKENKKTLQAGQLAHVRV